MKRPLLLIAAVATVVALVAVLVTVLLNPPGEGGTDSISMVSRGDSATAAARLSTGPDGEQITDLAAPLDGEMNRAAARDAAAEVGPRLAVEGRVIAPPGCSADATVEVIAFAKTTDIDDALSVLRPRGQRGQRQLNALDGSLGSELTDRLDRGVVGRAPLGGDGRFRLEVPASAKTVHLIAIGRSWFGRETQEYAPGATDKPLELTTWCGAWIEGVVAVPSSADVSELEGLMIELESMPDATSTDMRMVRNLHRYAAVREGAFEFPALDPDAKCELSAAPARLAAAKMKPGDLAPGRGRRVEFVFQTGGTIRGSVLDTSGAPIANARVSANQKGRWFGFDDKSVRYTASAADGSFELAGVAVGSAEIKAIAEGWLIDKPAKLEVVDTAVVEGVTVVLGRGATISGTVHWSDGTPAVGLDVEVAFDRSQMAGMGAFAMLKGASGEAKTDAQGRFAVTGLGAGPFVVEAAAVPASAASDAEADAAETPDVRDPRTGRKIPIRGRSAEARRQREHRARVDSVRPGTEGLALVLQPPTGVRGRVVDSAGVPVSKFRIELQGVGKGMLANVGQEEIDQDFEVETGEFLVQGVHAGKWQMHAEAEGYSASAVVEFDAPMAVDAPEFVIPLQRAAVVRGTVFAPDGTRAVGATISVDDGTPAWTRAMSSAKPPEAKSDEQGRFELSPLNAGSTAIIAQHEAYAQSVPLVLELSAGQLVEDAQLKLTLGGRITGEVFHEGEPATGMMIQVQEMKRFTQRMTHTDAKGRFELDHVDPGSYQVIAMPSMNESLVGESGELDTSSMLSNMKMTTTEVAEGTEVHVILGAPPEDPVRVRGTITMAGEPLASATVMFLPEGGSKGLSAFKPVQTKKDGTYAVTLDGPGGYSVSVQRMNLQMTGQSVHEERCVIPKSEEFVLDIVMPNGRISGRVTGTDGKPAVNARVSVVHEGAGKPGTMWGGQFHELRTDQEGLYDATGIAAGTYSVLAGGSEFGGMMGASSATGGREIQSGIVLAEADWRRGIDFRLKAPATVEVLVVDESDRPVSGAVIFGRDESGRAIDLFSFVTSDAAGVAKYGGLAAGRYSFRARTDAVSSRDSTLVRVEEGGKATVKLIVEKGTILIVKVVDGEKKPLVAAIEVLDENGHNVADQMGLAEVMERFQGGDFDATERKFGPFSAGKYKVRVTSESGKVSTKTVSLSGQAERRVTLELD